MGTERWSSRFSTCSTTVWASRRRAHSGPWRELTRSTTPTPCVYRYVTLRSLAWADPRNHAHTLGLQVCHASVPGASWPAQPCTHPASTGMSHFSPWPELTAQPCTHPVSTGMSHSGPWGELTRSTTHTHCVYRYVTLRSLVRADPLNHAHTLRLQVCNTEVPGPSWPAQPRTHPASTGMFWNYYKSYCDSNMVIKRALKAVQHGYKCFNIWKRSHLRPSNLLACIDHLNLYFQTTITHDGHFCLVFERLQPQPLTTIFKSIAREEVGTDVV